MGILYIVATPIGNLQDITLRAVMTLFHVDTIACEDTRRAGILIDNLLHAYEMLVYKEDRRARKPKFLSYFEQNELRRIPEIIALLLNGQEVALISDAGTPAISDPGFKLIREALSHNIKVVSIPGPVSPISALVSSGMPTDKFTFLGYPPAKSGHRAKFFEQIKESQKYIKSTQIMFEAPHKVIRTLEGMQNVFGDIEVAFCRELTKIHEEVRKERISLALIRFMKTAPRGEFVFVFTV